MSNSQYYYGELVNTWGQRTKKETVTELVLKASTQYKEIDNIICFVKRKPYEPSQNDSNGSKIR